MKDISLHILDITENSTNAGATKIMIRVVQNTKKGTLIFSIEDNGCGMDVETVLQLQNPFYTTRTTRKVGMGIPLLIQNTEQTGGNVSIKSEVGMGTQLIATFNFHHIDCPPLGDLSDVFINLLASFSDVQFEFILESEKDNFVLDSAMVKEVFGDNIARYPEVLMELKSFTKSNIHNVINP